jgi:hypothetical protein
MIAARYWATDESRRSGLSDPEAFPWANFVVSMASVALHALVGFILIWWLYAEEKTQSGDHEVDTPSGESEP